MMNSIQMRRAARVVGLISKPPGRPRAKRESALESRELEENHLPHPDDVGKRIDDKFAGLRRIAADPEAFEHALKILHEHAARGVKKADKVETLSVNEVSALEAVVEADGSRPAFVLKDGAVSLDDPLIGDWRADVQATAPAVARIAAATGRIQPAKGSSSNFFGTGTVVDAGAGLFLTNWHVVEAMCKRATTLYEYQGNGLYRIHDGVVIDFAAEAEAGAPVFFKVVKAQVSTIDGPEEFARLDAAVLTIEPMAGQNVPAAVRFTPDLAGPRGNLVSMCMIGHPGRPPEGLGTDAINGKTIDWAWVNATLFGSRYGVKRLSPGEVDTGLGCVDAAHDPRHWIFGHDATTLGGSSGTSIIAWRDGADAFGLHFAGATLRANYAHGIGACTQRLAAMGVPIDGFKKANAPKPAKPAKEEAQDMTLPAQSSTRENARRLRRYIAELPIGATPSSALEATDEAVDAVDIDNLPAGLVTGSSLLQFPAASSSELRASVALSLLAAQRVASADAVVQTPDQWVARHNTVLQNLHWVVETQSYVDSTHKDINVAVHKAIIPFVTAAFGAAATAARLIVKALEQLKEMDADKPWITLFQRESRRFAVNEFQFAVVETAGTNTRLRIAAARFDAKYGSTQVLFFRVTDEKAKFLAARSTMLADSSLLATMSDDLKLKLETQAKTFIKELKF